MLKCGNLIIYIYIFFKTQGYVHGNKTKQIAQILALSSQIASKHMSTITIGFSTQVNK